MSSRIGLSQPSKTLPFADVRNAHLSIHSGSNSVRIWDTGAARPPRKAGIRDFYSDNQLADCKSARRASVSRACPPWVGRRGGRRRTVPQRIRSVAIAHRESRCLHSDMVIERSSDCQEIMRSFSGSGVAAVHRKHGIESWLCREEIRRLIIPRQCIIDIELGWLHEL
jgi:hypothetical protein